MLASEFDYDLPEGLIAHFPAKKRDESNLMVLNKLCEKYGKSAHNNDCGKNRYVKKSGECLYLHKKFFDIVDFFDENDILVMNNTRVIPARLLGKKSTGANIEIFLLSKKTENTWEALIKPSKRVKSGTIVNFGENLSAKILERLPNDKWLAEFSFTGDFDKILEKVGNIPLPPYIERNLSDSDLKKIDFERYQTVCAQIPGSVAAPTAGLHFTEEILQKIRQKGTEICYVTLNIGLGTFKPVKSENILDHIMDEEFYEIPESTANIINNAQKQGKKITAVGTTSVRTLESAFRENGKISATSGNSRLFIYPGYKFNVIDRLITNFHLPKSTLIMLVSAFAGKDKILSAYKEAIEKKYRFYSYGDCMFIR